MNSKFFSLLKIRVVLFLSLSLVLPTTAMSQQLKIKPHEVPDPCNTNTPQIRVTVNGVGSGGMLNVGLYNDDPDNFLFKKGRKRTVRIPATDEQHVVCMNLDQPGTYAVAVYHDTNADRKLKLRWNMMPAEPFGLSNNPENQTSFPKFSDSAFTTGELGANIVVNLRQP